MDLHTKIRHFYKNENYSDLIKFYSPSDTINFTEWDYFYFINSLYKIKDYDRCLVVFKDHFHKRFPQSRIVNSTIGWALYKCKLKNFDFLNINNKIFFKQVNYILEVLTDINNPNDSLLRWKVIELTIEYLGTEIKVPNVLQLTNQYLNLVSPDNLSNTSIVVQLGNGRKIELSPSREIWYSKKSKCLISLGKFAECIEICDEALRVLSKFHHNNDCWFKYRKAQSLLSIGYFSESKSIINNILKTNFKHWCLYSLLFQIASKENDKLCALQNAGLCALCDNSHEMRIAFYTEFGQYLKTIGEDRLAQLHFQLVSLIKKEKTWKVKKTDILATETQILSMTKEDLLNELTSFWKSVRSAGIKYYSGEIVKLLHDGKAGFILNHETKQQHYFSIKDLNVNKKLQQGVFVTFSLAEKLDRKKGVLSLCAVDITIVE